MQASNLCFFSGQSLRIGQVNSPFFMNKEHLVSKHDLAGMVLTQREFDNNIVPCARDLNSGLGMAPAGVKIVFAANIRALGDNGLVRAAWSEYDVVSRHYGQHWWSNKDMNMPDSVTPFWSIRNKHYGITKEILAERNRCMRWARRVNKILIPILLEFGPEAARFEAHRRKYVMPTLDTSLEVCEIGYKRRIKT